MSKQAANHLIEGIGDVDVHTLQLPSDVHVESGTYTYSGKVLVAYRTTEDTAEDHHRLAVMEDDGNGFRPIFAGKIPQLPRANGVRYLPFEDNHRVLLGDYVLECSPDIDTCRQAELVPIRYPALLYKDPNITHRWSEVIISPDNRHISWTILTQGYSAVALGTLRRESDAYEVDDVRIISTLSGLQPDPSRPGHLLSQPVRGGEVKQFVRGGKAISLVGALDNATPDSVVLDLPSGSLTQVTCTPGYNETTIFSPDERLGMVMSTRFSTRTDPAIFGLVPRPYGTIALAGMIWYLYTYAVTGVRNHRRGNIGPALVEIERSMRDRNYLGVQLTTDEDWVYCSPMSWHPDGKRAMWPEMRRGSRGAHMRLQVVRLLDYEPGPSVRPTTTPIDLPYAVHDLEVLSQLGQHSLSGRIESISGYVEVAMEVHGHSGRTEIRYHSFSTDGINYYSGYERSSYGFTQESYYQAELQLWGPTPGEMQLRATFSPMLSQEPVRLLFERGSDGLPKSYGYATYGDRTLHIEALEE